MKLILDLEDFQKCCDFDGDDKIMKNRSFVCNTLCFRIQFTLTIYTITPCLLIYPGEPDFIIHILERKL